MRHALVPLLLGAAALAGCVAPVGPVEVTRFHDAAALARLGSGTISVEAAPGMDESSLELRSYQIAVGQELARIGYAQRPAGEGAQVAQVQVERFASVPEDMRGPVSVGVSGSTGSFGSGVGVGLGINLGGGAKEQVTTRLSVMIRDHSTRATLWEGRSEFTVSSSSPMADTQLGAAKLAEALFAGFPGNNGETVLVP